MGSLEISETTNNHVENKQKTFNKKKIYTDEINKLMANKIQNLKIESQLFMRRIISISKTCKILDFSSIN